jgi:hypothetical protein
MENNVVGAEAGCGRAGYDGRSSSDGVGFLGGITDPRLAGRAILRVVLAVLLLNGLFLFLIVLPLDDPSTTRHRIRAAFETGDLGFDDFRLFDSRRGFFQYNDCNVLQMIANSNPSRLSGALSPIVYSANHEWTDQCAVLQRVASEGADLAGLIENHYSRYWHGYRVGVAMGLRTMEIRTLRRVLGGGVWLSLAALLALTDRAGRTTRRVGLAITLSAAFLWAVPYFDQGFTFGLGDAALIFGLVVLAARPHLAQQVDTIAPFAAIFGAVIAFFEMLTGQLPVAAAWLVAVIVAIRRDQARSAATDVRVLSLAVAAFGIGAVFTILIKQVLAFTLSDPAAGHAFLSHIAMYAAVPQASGQRPGILLPFIRLADAAYVLTYGSKSAGYVLVMLLTLLWVLGAVLAVRDRRETANMDRVVLLVASLAPVVWVLLFPQHTVIHALFMVRILVASIALVPLAVSWPVAALSNRPLERVAS